MADYYVCRTCEAHLLRVAPGRSADDLGACPVCGTEAWAGVVELAGSSAGAASSGRGDVSVRPDRAQGLGQVIPVEAVSGDEMALPIADHLNVEPTIPIEDLPAEVVAEVLRVGVNFLRPHEGYWAIEITVGLAGPQELAKIHVGDRQDALLAAAEWIDGLAVRWEDKLSQADVEGPE